MFAPETPIEDVPLAVVDVETTGLNPRAGDRVCEIAVLRVDPGGAAAPVGVAGQPRTTHRRGRSSREWYRGRRRCQRAAFRHPHRSRSTPAWTGAVLVAHNVPFDVGFLRAEYRRAETRFPTMQALDTLESWHAELLSIFGETA